MQGEVDAAFIERSMDEIEASRAEDGRAERVFSALVEAGDPRGELKRGVISTLLNMRDRNALYFIVRSLLLQLISSALFLVALAILGTISFVQAIILGVIIFTTSLALSRLLEGLLNRATKSIIAYLEGHQGLKNFILNNF